MGNSGLYLFLSSINYASSKRSHGCDNQTVKASEGEAVSSPHLTFSPFCGIVMYDSGVARIGDDKRGEKE